jgi:hypothetical protein
MPFNCKPCGKKYFLWKLTDVFVRGHNVGAICWNCSDKLSPIEQLQFVYDEWADNKEFFMRGGVTWKMVETTVLKNALP